MEKTQKGDKLVLNQKEFSGTSSLKSPKGPSKGKDLFKIKKESP